MNPEEETGLLLFFDIDGTLVSFKTHEIPASTIQALTQAKKNGSRVSTPISAPSVSLLASSL